MLTYSITSSLALIHRSESRNMNRASSTCRWELSNHPGLLLLLLLRVRMRMHAHLSNHTASPAASCRAARSSTASAPSLTCFNKFCAQTVVANRPCHLPC